MGLKQKMADAVGAAMNMSITRPDSLNAHAEDHFVREMLKRLEIDCVFDVGANVGQYGCYLRRIGYSGRILSFEPGPQMVTGLRKASAGDPLWDVFPFALGESAGTLPLNIMKLDAMSSFLQPAVDQSASYSAINVVEKVVHVEVRALATMFDELRAQYGFSRPFLKLDTQGFDLHVVRGAGDKLARFPAILSEVAVRRLYDGSPHMIDALAFYDELGFDLIGIYKVHASEVLDPHEFNCYVLRRGTV